MDAQHVICAGRVRHAARQTDATCHKSAVFSYMAGDTQLPLLKEYVLTLPTATFSGMLSGTISGCP